MATQAKFNTVLPSNTIQQGLNYTGISSVYASKLNTLGQAENVMTANDVELSLNTYNPGATASINIPASYKLLGNMYLKMVVSLKTLLYPPQPTDSATYAEIYNNSDGSDSLIFSNCPQQINARDPYSLATGNPGDDRTVGTGTLNTGLPMDINFLAYQLIKQFTYRIPGCDRIYIQGIHMLPWLLDKCPTEEEKIKLAMMSGSSQFLYNYNMRSGRVIQAISYLKNAPQSGAGRDWICEDDQGNMDVMNPGIIVNAIDDPQFVIYALLPMPWTTIDKDKQALYYPSHMTTSALELNIQFQDANYLRVPAEVGYSGYSVTIRDASIRFTYAQVATLTYYKPPIYKLPCSLPYGFVFPVKDYHQSQQCSVNLLGLKNGEITQLQLFIHQQAGGTVSEVLTSQDAPTTAGSMRFKWRNEPLRNVQVEYAGQIIWKGLDDQFDFMNQFDGRKGWSSFKFPSMLTVKSTINGSFDRSAQLGSRLFNNAGVVTTAPSCQQSADPYGYYPGFNRAVAGNAMSRYILNDNNATIQGFDNSIYPHSDYFIMPRASLSNFVDISTSALAGSITKDQLDSGSSGASLKTEVGLNQYMRSIFSNSFYPSASTLPFGKSAAWSTLYTGINNGTTIFGMEAANSTNCIKANTEYNYGDQFYWTTVPVAEKIDQIRGPRDYNLGADFKDSNLIAKFSGLDPMSSTTANYWVNELASKVRWDLHLIVSITSAFIFNGDRAELMQ